MADTFVDALTDEEAGDRHAAGRRRSYGANVTVFHEGDDAGPVVVLLAGRVKVATIGADSQQTQFATHDVVGRVAQRLVELVERFGAEEGGRVEIALPPSQEELESWTGASREAVSKALQLFRSLHIVETGHKHITVLDPEALRRRAQ
jgi:CRP/FNR family transcriptional regulator, cyclic AMP receptor protein